mmetsp:Transcript_36349/g.84071  ORF Transcript_36349/g.84071 Transcript_36349/m.84071 type:complete len:232 (+) Transcript_36349:541-1236(+)
MPVGTAFVLEVPFMYPGITVACDTTSSSAPYCWTKNSLMAITFFIISSADASFDANSTATPRSSSTLCCDSTSRPCRSSIAMSRSCFIFSIASLLSAWSFAMACAISASRSSATFNCSSRSRTCARWDDAFASADRRPSSASEHFSRRCSISRYSAFFSSSTLQRRSSMAFFSVLACSTASWAVVSRSWPACTSASSFCWDEISCWRSLARSRVDWSTATCRSDSSRRILS